MEQPPIDNAFVKDGCEQFTSAPESNHPAAATQPCDNCNGSGQSECATGEGFTICSKCDGSGVQAATPEETATPETDAAEAEYRRGSNDWTVELNKSYGLARSLERRLTTLKAELAAALAGKEKAEAELECWDDDGKTRITWEQLAEKKAQALAQMTQERDEASKTAEEAVMRMREMAQTCEAKIEALTAERDELREKVAEFGNPGGALRPPENHDAPSTSSPRPTTAPAATEDGNERENA